MSRDKRYKDISYYMRGELRKALDNTQLGVDFDTIVAEQWKEVMNPYVSLASEPKEKRCPERHL